MRPTSSAMFNIFTRHCLLCLADYLNRVSIAFFVIEHIAAKRGTPRYPIWQQGVPLSLPPTHTACSRTSPGQVSERRTLPLLGLGRVCSRRRRGPAGLRDLFAFAKIGICTSCAQGLSVCARRGGYHYPQRALRAAETPDGRLSKRLICRFLRSGGRSSPHDSYAI